MGNGIDMNFDEAGRPGQVPTEEFGQRKIGIEGGMSPVNPAAMKLAAYLEVIGGKELEEVAAEVGVEFESFWKARQSLAYQNLVREAAEKVVTLRHQSAQDLDDLFDSMVAPSALAVEQILRNPFEKGTTRLKAAEFFTNRAPKAPRNRREDSGSHVTKIIIPIQQVGTMRKALAEEDETKLLEMMEGAEGEWEAPQEGGDD